MAEPGTVTVRIRDEDAANENKRLRRRVRGLARRVKALETPHVCPPCYLQHMWTQPYGTQPYPFTFGSGTAGGRVPVGSTISFNGIGSNTNADGPRLYT